MSSKLKISSKTQVEAKAASEEQPTLPGLPEPVAAKPAAPTADVAHSYGKGGTYRSLGGGKRVKV